MKFMANILLQFKGGGGLILHLQKIEEERVCFRASCPQPWTPLARLVRPMWPRLGLSCAALGPGGQMPAHSGGSNCGPGSSTKPPCLHLQWAALQRPV